MFCCFIWQTGYKVILVCPISFSCIHFTIISVFALLFSTVWRNPFSHFRWSYLKICCFIKLSFASELPCTVLFSSVFPLILHFIKQTLTSQYITKHNHIRDPTFHLHFYQHCCCHRLLLHRQHPPCRHRNPPPTLPPSRDK